MKIARVHSHLGGMEFIQIHQPDTWAEIESAITAVDGRDSEASDSAEGAPHRARHNSPSRVSAEIGKNLKGRGWRPRRPGDSDFVKECVGIEIHFGRRPLDTYDLCARHIARYIGKVIDVGVEILPMKSLQQQMSSGIGYYEGELYNLIREGRGVPAVPLVLIGICPD
jgi:hypothetical protein